MVTQEELAARLQSMGLRINQAALSKIENGERQVTDVEVLGTCRTLGVRQLVSTRIGQYPEAAADFHPPGSPV